MNKDEFKESMRDAKIREEMEGLMAQEEGAVSPEKPKRGRPRKAERTDKEGQNVKNHEKTSKNSGKSLQSSRKPSKKAEKAATVAAGRFNDKEREALQCLTQIAENHTADILDKAGALLEQADKLTNISILYRDYIDTVKEMIK
jgi:hypothetical protein